MADHNEQYMRRALALARKGIGKTSPNPAVGCVIVRDDVIVGEGWHRKAGTPHAEVHALREAGADACGADVYVTLEPCSHFGKTPPCADALIAAKVKRVVVGMVDPNPKVMGRGIEKLRAAGIEVVDGLLEAQCRQLNEPFIKHVTTGLPFVIYKSAMTMDGKTATSSGDSKWITSEKSRRYVHKLRAMVDAIMVGVGTVTADDPLLTSRIPGGRDPLRVIVDSGLRIKPGAAVLSVSSPAKTVIATVAAASGKAGSIRSDNVEIIICPEQNGRVDSGALLKILGERGVQSILLEGGAELAGDFLRQGLIDKFLFFYAPKLVGGDAPGPFRGSGTAQISAGLRLRDISIRRFDDDMMVEAYPCSQD